jgi:hypothetical protein
VRLNGGTVPSRLCRRGVLGLPWIWIIVMMLPSLLVLGAHLATPVADNIPLLNIEPVCQGIAQQGGSSFHDTEVAKQKQDCLESEKQVREDLVKQWPSFSAADKNACIREATMGGDSSYTELLTCLEMARDARNLHNDSNGPAITSSRTRSRR